jgi:hypothetical protein
MDGVACFWCVRPFPATLSGHWSDRTKSNVLDPLCRTIKLACRAMSGEDGVAAAELACISPRAQSQSTTTTLETIMLASPLGCFGQGPGREIGVGCCSSFKGINCTSHSPFISTQRPSPKTLAPQSSYYPPNPDIYWAHHYRIQELMHVVLLSVFGISGIIHSMGKVSSRFVWPSGPTVLDSDLAYYVVVKLWSWGLYRHW